MGEGGFGVVSVEGEQGEAAAQHRPRFGLHQIAAQCGGGGVDAGHDGGAGELFGAGGQRVGVHVGGAGKALPGVVFGARGVCAETCAPSRLRMAVRMSTAVGGWVALGARMRCGSASLVEK